MTTNQLAIRKIDTIKVLEEKTMHGYIIQFIGCKSLGCKGTWIGPDKYKAVEQLKKFLFLNPQKFKTTI